MEYLRPVPQLDEDLFDYLFGLRAVPEDHLRRPEDPRAVSLDQEPEGLRVLATKGFEEDGVGDPVRSCIGSPAVDDHVPDAKGQVGRFK